MMRPGRNPIRFFATIAGAVVFVIAGLTVFFGSWYTVDQTERAVLLRNGAFVEVVQPGLHFKLPWAESVYKIDMQTHTKTYGQDASSGKDIMEAYSADQQPAFLRVSVTLHIAPDKVAEMYSRFGGDYDAALGRVISPHVYERVKVVFGQYTAAKAISARGQLNADASNSITQSIAYDPVFIIESAQIENISFSPDYIHSVEQRMQAEVEVQRQQQNYQQEKIKADIAVTQATGRANSVRAEAQASADATVLRGNAEATAIKAKADALASNSNLIALTQAERWNGALPTTMVPGSAVPFISVK
jgi:regulator of protease activity HflC (stomatin/prohibitin superfamily)